MDSRISIPTDNIHKFYAIFGLVICITAATLFVFTYNFHHEETVSITLELAKLDSVGELNAYQKDYKGILEKRLEVGTSNKKFYMSIIFSVLGAGIAILCSGFFNWHFKVQPKIDELTDLQIAKLKLELAAANTKAPFYRRGRNV